MDAAARELLDACAPHVPTALLAHLYRLGEPFPPQTEPRSGVPLDAVFAIRAELGLPQYTADYVNGGDYIRFQCTGCQTLVFQPGTDRGIRFEARMARDHLRDCCDERRAEYERTGVVTCWPDRLDE